MYLKRNRSRYGQKEYVSVLLVQGERIALPRPPGRPAKDAPAAKTRVGHRTLANLSKLPPDLLALVDGYCKGEVAKAASADAEVGIGPAYGPLAVARTIALACGVEAALGHSRKGKLALFLV